MARAQLNLINNHNPRSQSLSSFQSMGSQLLEFSFLPNFPIWFHNCFSTLANDSWESSFFPSKIKRFIEWEVTQHNGIKSSILALLLFAAKTWESCDIPHLLWCFTIKKGISSASLLVCHTFDTKATGLLQDFFLP